MTIKKEEMQAKFFLRYESVRKAIVILIFALILQMFVHSPEFGYLSGYYHVAVDLITVLLVFLELYYFFKVEGKVV